MKEETVKFFDSELKVLSLLWEHGDLSASDIAKILEKEIGWKRNTTYTVIKKCVDKGGIERIEPGFMCHSLVTKDEVQQFETNELINKLFDDSNEAFMAAFVSNRGLSKKQIRSLKNLIDDLSEEDGD